MIEIKEITSSSHWNSWLQDQQPNTFLQSWEWGQVQQADGEKVRYLGFFDQGQQIGAALIITVNARRGTFLLCPHGPIFISTAAHNQHLPQFTRHLQKLARNDGAVAIRIAPLEESTPENKQVFKRLGYRHAPIHIHAELTWVLDITPSEEEILSGMRKTTRHAIRKAAKEGVTVDIINSPDGLARFWPLYEATKDRHGFTPFPEQFLKRQALEFTRGNRLYFAFANYRGQTVAGAMLIHFGSTVFYHHGASQKLPSSVPAAQLLHFESIKEARRRRAKRYNFWGIAPDDQPHHPFAGITVFKKGFGGHAIDYIHLQDLPATAGYWKLWVVETWRRYKKGF